MHAILADQQTFTDQQKVSVHCTESANVWVDLEKSSWWTLKPEIKDVV